MTAKTVTQNAVSKKKGKKTKKPLPVSIENAVSKKKGKITKKPLPVSIENAVSKKKGKKTKKPLSVSTEAVEMKGKKTKVSDTASTEAEETKENVPVPTEEVEVNKEVKVNNAATTEEPEVEAKEETVGVKIGKKIKKKKKKTLKGNKAGKIHRLTLSRDDTKESPVDEVEEGTGVRLAVLNQAIEGVRLLEKQRHSKKENQRDLLGDDGVDTVIYLQVSMVKVANLLHRAKHLVRPVKMKVPIPNSLVNSNTDVLLITKDDDEMKDIRDDHTENLHHYQHKLKVCGASRHISEVITLRQLKVEFKEYEAKRNLSNRTDVVLCDDTILRRIPMFLGKHFYGKRKFPVPVNLKSKNLLNEIERCLRIEILWLPMKGNSGLMKIGRLDQSNEKIVENIQAALKKMQKQFPGGWTNIQALYLKTERSKAVPFYAKISSVNDIGSIAPKPLSKRPTVSGEVSSAYGDIYTVYPDYNVEYTSRVSYKRNEEEEMRRKEVEKMEAVDVEGTSETKKRKKKESATKKAKEDDSESPKKKKKTPGSAKVEPSKQEVSGDAIVSKKKKKKVVESAKSEVPKKDKKLSKAKQKKGKKALLDLDSDDEQLDKMEREYLKRLDMEQAGGETTKKEESDDDDWAEGSGDDIDISDFEDEGEL